MNPRLLVQTWRWQAAKLAVVIPLAVGWGWLMPFFFSQFSEALREMATANPLFERLSNFGSGNLFTVAGAMTLSFQHPIAIALVAIFAVGATSVAIAGERQRGTLEVLLARPVSRSTLVITLSIALVAAAIAVVGAHVGGSVLGVFTQGLDDELDLTQLPLVLLNGALLWTAFATFGIAASASFDRAGPAIGLSLAYLLANYFFEILGSLWTDAAWTQEYSLFHHFQPIEIFAGEADPFDFVLLAVVAAVPFVAALLIFRRRDLAAPA
jgi:ABC-2 type transport system permease protein